MRIFKTLLLACVTALMLNGCGYDQVGTLNRIAGTRWYFLDYQNDYTTDQYGSPVPQSKSAYLSQNNCLSGEIYFGQPLPSGYGEFQINDYCGRATSQSITYDNYLRKKIEFFLNGKASNEKLTYYVEPGSQQNMQIDRSFYLNGSSGTAEGVYESFRIFFSESGNEMIWLFTGSNYNRRITWSKNFQPVP